MKKAEDFLGKQFDLSRSEKRCVQLRVARADELERRAEDLLRLAASQRELALREAREDALERIGAPEDLEVEFSFGKDKLPSSFKVAAASPQPDKTVTHELEHELVPQE